MIVVRCRERTAFPPLGRACASPKNASVTPLFPISPLFLSMQAFLDRNPRDFEFVLDYLRNGGQLPQLPADEVVVERVRRECEFFCSPAFGPKT